MIDLLTPTQDAFFAALDVPAVTGLAPVMQHVEENVQPPLVVIADMSAEAIGGKDGGLDRVSVTIITMVRSPKRAKLFELQAAVRSVLDGIALSSLSVLLSPPVQTGQDSELLEDGETYFGTQRFETVVQPLT